MEITCCFVIDYNPKKPYSERIQIKAFPSWKLLESIVLQPK